VSQQSTHSFHMESFNLKKLNEVEGKAKYSAEASNRFAALENLDLLRVWETITKNIKMLGKGA
jgi:hypothetical protein